MNSAMETFVPLQFKRKKGKLLVDGRESAHDVRIIEAVARAMYWPCSTPAPSRVWSRLPEPRN